jgi:hypothetical protein
VTANENHIVFGYYFVKEPQVFCYFGDAQYIGKHDILMKTTAACDVKYIAEQNYTIAFQ